VADFLDRQAVARGLPSPSNAPVRWAPINNQNIVSRFPQSGPIIRQTIRDPAPKCFKFKDLEPTVRLQVFSAFQADNPCRDDRPQRTPRNDTPNPSGKSLDHPLGLIDQSAGKS